MPCQGPASGLAMSIGRGPDLAMSRYPVLGPCHVIFARFGPCHGLGPARADDFCPGWASLRMRGMIQSALAPFRFCLVLQCKYSLPHPIPSIHTSHHITSHHITSWRQVTQANSYLPVFLLRLKTWMPHGTTLLCWVCVF